MAPRTTTRAEPLNKLREELFRDLRVALPARVVSYDATKQVADLQPLITDYFPEDDGTTSQVKLPLLVSVPVIFPGAGGFRVTFPVQAGDVVQVLINDRSLDAWLDQGGLQAPGDLRRHCLSDAVAIPGLHDGKNAWAGARSDGVTLGQDGGLQVAITGSAIELGGTDDAVAKAASVESELNALWTAIHTHTHTGVSTGSGTSGPSATTGSAGSVGSSAVKVKG